MAAFLCPQDFLFVLIIRGAQLLFGTVQPSGTNAVSFVMQADGNNYQLTANCNQGTINGQEPSNAEEAELLNAACQVAYGSV